MDQCRRHCPCKNKYELFKNSASSKRNSTEKTQGKYYVSLNFTVYKKKKSGKGKYALTLFMFLQVLKK